MRAAALASACAAAGCGSATTSVVQPSGTKCDVTATSSTPELPSAGGTGSVAVVTSRDCQWSASADAAWVTLTTTSGQGPGTISFSVPANPAGTRRRAHVTVGQQSVDVAQAAAPCRYDASPSSLSVDAAGRQVTIALSSLDGCAWTARSDSPWIAGISPASGAGSATVRATVLANAAEARAGALTIGDAAVRITQSAPADATPAPSPAPPSPAPPPPEPPPPAPPPACTYRLAPAARNVGRAADAFSVGISAPPACTWSVSSDASWITVIDGRSGSGDGSFRLAVAANNGAPRTGTVRAATETFSVQQAGGECRYSIKPANYHAGRGPDDIRIDVTADEGCAWTTSTSADWVTVADGRSGAGNGSVRLVIPANAGEARTATVVIANTTFTLRQDGSPSCSSDTSIKPTNYHAGRGPDDIKIKVKARDECTWTSTSPVDWVTVIQGAIGSGDGDVRLIVLPNFGPDRSATLTIAGQPFDLRQDGPR
jgi:all-beta uncharacterized protein/BACON domain-containing protein